jgi:hypothetical protein
MMNIRLIPLVLAASAAFSTASFAAATAQRENHPADRMEMASRCSDLESQFNNAIGGAQQGPTIGRAKSLDSAGTAECNANEGDLGVVKLNQALTDLGAKPSS